MGDIVDIANDYAADFVSDNEKLVRGRVPEERPDLDEDVECMICSEPVEKNRARLGYEICYDCASWQEKSNKQYNRRRVQEYED